MTSGTSSSALDDLRSVLQHDRLIKVYITDDATPYLIQEAVLTSISDFFVKALKNQQYLGEEKGVLKFPDDDKTAWEVLLHWKIKGSLEIPDSDPEEAVLQYIHCWILGGKYDIKTFQDLVILELLRILDRQFVTFDAVKLALRIRPRDLHYAHSWLVRRLSLSMTSVAPLKTYMCLTV